MKKLLSLLLVAVMALTMVSVASADDLYEKPLVLGYTQDLMSSNFYAIPAGVDNLCFKIVGGQPILCDDVNGQYAPMLFESWEVSEDQLVWTFHLRQDAYWHDGVQVTADDVIFSEAYLKEMDQFENWHCWWQFEFPYQLNKVDDFTVEFVLEAPTSALLSNLSDQMGEIIPKHIWENVERKDFTNVEAAKLPVGFGPYKMVAYEPGVSITLEANEAYFGGAPKIKTIIIQIMPSTASATLALEAGDIDGLSLSSIEYERMLSEGKIAGTQIALIAEHLISFNYEREELQDTRMRQALNYLMDNETVLDGAYGGIGKVVYGTFIDEVMYSDTSVWVDYSYNVEKAKALIEEMGYTIGSDGYYQKDGKTLEFELMYTGSNDTFANVCLIYQATAQAGGVKLNLAGLDSAVITEKRNNYDYDLVFGGWSLGIDNSMYSANKYYGEGAFHETYANSARVDELFVEGASSADDEVRANAYRELDKILSEDPCYVYIIQRGQCFGYNKALDISEAERSSGNDFNYWNKLAWKE